MVAGMLLVGAAACGDSPTAPSTARYRQTDVIPGSGTEAVTGTVVTVNYTGWLYDASKLDGKGLQFDSSSTTAPFAFTLGAGQVIQGWDKGVAGMCVGGRRQLTIPPDLAYGAQGAPPDIAPNETLIFVVHLERVQKG